MPRLALLTLLACLAPALAAPEGFSAQVLEQKAIAFIEAKNARQQPDSDAQDVERFLALLADEFVDEHIKFGVVVTDKDELRRGMLRKLDDQVFYSRIDVQQIMTGRTVAFVKYVESAKVKPTHLNEVIEYTSTNIIALEFDERGLINHIRRHHGG